MPCAIKVTIDVSDDDHLQNISQREATTLIQSLYDKGLPGRFTYSNGRNSYERIIEFIRDESPDCFDDVNDIDNAGLDIAQAIAEDFSGVDIPQKITGLFFLIIESLLSGDFECNPASI